MARAIILLLDSFGVGFAEDASPFDQGANTLGHIAEWCQHGKADDESRQGPLQIPNMTQLGLTLLAKQSAQRHTLVGLDYPTTAKGWYGFAKEQSYGKDTPSGHWEIAGVPVLFDWGYFKPDYPSFPDALIKQFLQQTQLPGILGNKAASGTDIIDELGEEHIKTGKPILYTSADSVLQIACHEQYFGLDKLYDICKIARPLVDSYNIGRVIARPFVGEVDNFTRTGNRRDYSTPPPAPTLLDKVIAEQGKVIAIGKIADIYAHQGISESIKADGNMALFDATLEAIKTAPDKSLIFTNFVDFDMLYGHRRNVTGYAKALEALDRRLPELQALLQPDDMVVISADHGCDPTWEGTDHTREHIPIVIFGPKFNGRCIGERETFSDIGQTIADHLGLSALNNGTSFYTNVE